jgi:CpXC protein
MPQTRSSCPRCRQPVVVDLNQLFDVNTDPKAKQLLLSGGYNLIQCQNCGYQGNLSTPIVYHDADKELLLTFFPPELGLPLNEQERLIGPLITQVTNRLPNEKRKAYLFRPQTVFTIQGLIERILEKDGVTKEMLQAQQQRVNVLQRLMTATTDDARVAIAQQEDLLIDEQFFMIVNRLLESAAASGDEQGAKALAELMSKLMPITSVGRALQAQAQEQDEAVKSVQEAAKNGLTREALIELVVNAPSETRLATIVSLTRTGLDYTFFQLLSQKIENASEADRQKLIDLREKLVDMTQEIDQEVKKQVEEARNLLESLIKSNDIEQALVQNLPKMTDLFVEILKNELQTSQKNGDKVRQDKLQKIVAVIQQVSAPPAEVAIIEEMLDAENDIELRKIFEDHRAEITTEFIQFMNGLVNQAQAQKQEPEIVDKLQKAYRMAMRFTMEANLK